MAGQGIQRREVLRILALAAGAATFPGFTRWSYACDHGTDPAQIKPASYTPLFFQASEYALIDCLADLILPSDATPGARAAGVPEFIDFMVAHDTTVQYSFRTGLTLLNAESNRRHGAAFIKVSAAQQNAMLEPLAYTNKFRAGEEDLRAFFKLVREYTLMGFYTSEIGYKELNNPALKFYAQSPECPHTDDPEHRHLPAPVA